MKRLLAQGAGKSGELAIFHASAAGSSRHTIEARALKDPELRDALAKQALAGLAGGSSDSTAANLKTLHHLAWPGAKTEVLKLLSSSESSEVAEQAIIYLGRVNAAESFSAVHQIALNSSDVCVKSTAIRNLILCGGMQNTEQAMQVLEPALSDPSPTAQAEALRVLGRFPRRITSAMRARIAELAKPASNESAESRVASESARMLLALLKNLPEEKKAGP